MKWRSIETAPKGEKTPGVTLIGPHILGATPYGVLRLHWWNGNEGDETRFQNWIGDCGNAYHPTHWMPLPAPPKQL